MTAEPDADASRELDELVVRALDAFDRGAHAELEELCNAHPAHASALRRRLALLGELGVLGSERAAAPGSRLGEFELVELLGAGGMGVVYRARQARLGRDVALKVVRPEVLHFPETRERFRREVATVARLQHPGIAPVHDVGEANGVPYFTMELLAGASLEALLARVRGRDPAALAGADLAPQRERAGYLFAGTWEEACLRVVRQVAEALAHAHERGVVHRDLKPSNVMLTAGESSRAVLLDFGLATLAGSGKLTRTGSQLGTLDYMAPEQVRGGAETGPRADVYSLGATLYELLTLRKPYAAESLATLALAIERGGLRAPRAANPALSWEAETVVLTAMDRDPARRYADAGAFARDLGHVLDRRPIDARRMGPALAARRWVQRNPMRAVAAALAALVALGGPSLYAWQQRRASLEVRAERDVARANYERALGAVDAMLVEVASERLADVPEVQTVRRALLEKARGFYGELLEAGRGEARVAEALGEVHRRLASVLRGLGDFEAAAAAARTAIEVASRVPARDPTAFAARHTRALARQSLAVSLWKLGRPADAEPEARAALAELAELVAERPADDRLRLAAAEARTDFGFVLRSAGRLDEAERELAQAQAGSEPLRAAHASDTDFAVPLARIRRERAFVATFRNDLARARELHAEEVALLEPAYAAHPDDRAGEHELAVALANLGRVALDLRDVDAAAGPLGRAVDLMRRYAIAYPLDASARSTLAGTLVNLGILEGVSGGTDATLARFEEAREHLRRAASDRPENLDPRLQLAQLEFNIAMAHGQRGEIDRAAARLDDALATLAPVRTAHPDNVEYAGLERVMVQRAVQVALELGRGERAFELCDRHVPAAGADGLLEHARLYASCAPSLADERRAAALDRTFAALQRALDAGLARPDALESDTWRALAPDARLDAARATLRARARAR